MTNQAPPRATKFLDAMRAIDEAHRTVEELADGQVGYQLREILAAKVSINLARERLVAVANLRHPDPQDATGPEIATP